MDDVFVPVSGVKIPLMSYFGPKHEDIIPILVIWG
jgi:hypothetical protein